MIFRLVEYCPVFCHINEHSRDADNRLRPCVAACLDNRLRNAENYAAAQRADVVNAHQMKAELLYLLAARTVSVLHNVGDDSGSGALCHLHNLITCKAVAYKDVAIARKSTVALNISYEIKTVILSKHGVRFLNQLITLRRLGAV